MDNYKIKVKDEAESKEAQELFFELGYSNRQSKRFGFVYTQDGEIGCDSMEHWDYYNDLCQELTLPQLRDLVSPQKDPALISGAEAIDALKSKMEVEYCGDGKNDSWLSAETLPIVYFLTDSFKFRLKPTTLKVNAELPKPHKETQHNSLVYAVTYEFKTREERNAFADKLRGANS